MILKNLNKSDKIILIFYLLVPLLSSLISSIHLIEFFEIGNYFYMSLILSLTYEIGSISALLVLTRMINRVNKNLLWSIFILLAFMQIVGNVYFSFDFINKNLLINENYLNSIHYFLEFFLISDSIKNTHIIISLIIGIPIPLISLFFLKSIINFLSFEKKNEIEKEEKKLKENKKENNIDLKDDEVAIINQI